MSLGALIPKNGFALDRQDYIAGARQYIEGGIGEFFKCEVARANGYMEYVGYWTNEVDTIIDNTFISYLHNQRLKGANRVETKRKALEEAIATANIKFRWTHAANKIAQQLDIPVLKLRMPDKDMIEAAYWVRVRAAIADGLPD